MINTLAPELESSYPGQLEAEKLPRLKHVIRIGSDTTSGMYKFDSVCAAGTAHGQATMDALQARLQPDDAINIQITSGTTGNPKGATLSHCNILNNGFLTGLAMQLGSEDKLCIPVPL